jgi:hypothetical protein
MDTAIAFYEERKSEIEFYYSVLLEMIKPNSAIQTVDNNRFERILKSNFLLMLYNLIESCVRKGFENIYEAVKNSGEPYVKISEELCEIWSNYEISKAHKDTATKQTYGQRVKEIIEQVISNLPIVITRDALDMSGNLDALRIRRLLDNHKIPFAETNPGDKVWIFVVKKKRNALAHGDETFDDAARDLTVAELGTVKEEVLIFIRDVLASMNTYHENRQYLRIKSKEDN